jgi:hypothetical protein
MKKFLGIIGTLLLMTGCSLGADMENTPTKKVEAMLSKYQTLDSNVLTELDSVVDEEVLFDDEQRNEYKEIMKKHYQDLTYEIKDETIDGDSAVVTVEIEVNDYSKVMANADQYLEDNREEFYNEENEYDEGLFTKYRLDQLKSNNERVKYTLELTLNKVDGEWKLNELSESDRSKINGMYES